MPVNVDTDAINQLSPIDTCKNIWLYNLCDMWELKQGVLLQSMQNVY